jgi:hypothetical protein
MRFQFCATAMTPLRNSRAQFRRVSRRKGANSRIISRLIAALNAAWRSIRSAQGIGKPLLTNAEQMAGAVTARKVASFWDENVGKHCGPFAHWESPAPIQHALNKLSTPHKISRRMRLVPPKSGCLLFQIHWRRTTAGACILGPTASQGRIS